MNIVGFDFGTTNSLMSIVVGDRCIPILEDGMPHPSVVSYRGGACVVGAAAKRELVNAQTGVTGHIVKSPKTLLGRHSVSVDGHTYSPQAVVRDVVAHVVDHARNQRVGRQTGSSFDRAVVTIPVDMNGERRRDLREACRMAGLNVYQFVHEPLAALYGHLRTQPDYRDEFARLNRQLVLVFDWGGGTLDLTLCRVVDGMLVQVRNHGCSDVGGDIVDDMLANEVERRVLEARGIHGSVTRQVGALARLRAKAEEAKIRLSSVDEHYIGVLDYFGEGAGDVDLEYRLTRPELEAIVKAKIDDGVGRVEALLREARIDPSEVALCLATGGMVNLPLIQVRLREIFGAGRVQVSARGNTIISEGAAWIAHDEARLVLAKNIEVQVARSAYFPVIYAGALMPREAEVHKPPAPLSLYCCDPTDAIAKFIVMTPRRTGRAVQVTDDRDCIGTLAVKVDPTKRPLLERLLLDVSIDENLVLRIGANSTIAADSDSTEVHNLEFGLRLGEGQEPVGESLGDLASGNAAHEPGAIQLRSNLARSAEDRTVVPGEVLARFDAIYFDRRSKEPPEHQREEEVFYKPCSACGHVYCRCAELRQAEAKRPPMA